MFSNFKEIVEKPEEFEKFIDDCFVNENQKCGYCGDSEDPNDICDKCFPKD
jgi:hypothetical protein